MTVIFEKMVGKEGVILEEGRGLMVTTNGWQWTVVPLSCVTLGLIKEAITAFEALDDPTISLRS